MKILLFIILLFVHLHLFSKNVVLFDSNKNYFSIGTNKGTIAEQQAAKMLQLFLTRQSNRDWPIFNKVPASPINLILINEDVNPRGEDVNGGYRIVIKNNMVELKAAASLLKTCVAQFLEQFTGCRVYADSVSYIPTQITCIIPAIYSHLYIPYFGNRLLYERSAFDSLFIAWHGLSNKPGPLNNDRSFGWGLWVHTFFDLVPPAQYFQSNPEYYSLRGNKRVAEQLCLSNKKLLAIVVANLEKRMGDKPDIKYWSVSQMDNQAYCECNECKLITKEEQSNSGPVIRFVNAVARHFPDKIIGTLAYQYSRKAPAVTKPLRNVAIVICAIEADRSKPLDDPGQKDGFALDLKKWTSISSNMMVWDYAVPLASIGSPFPNLDILQPNLQFFKRMNVKLVFEQGWHLTGGGVQEYRAYLLAKLLWNPDINVDSLKKDFFNGYYGKAGKSLMQVIDLMQQKFKESGLPLSIYDGPAAHAKGYLTEDLRLAYTVLIKDAVAEAANDPVISKRVDAFAQAFRLADLEVNWDMIGGKRWVTDYTTEQRINLKQYNDSLLNVFVDKTKIYGPYTMKENRLTPSEWKLQRKQRFQINAETNKAAGATITFKYPYDPVFGGVGPNTLVDGSFGTDDWSTTWQGWSNTDIDATVNLKKSISISSVSVRFIKDTDYNLVIPDSLLVLVSNDGNTYTKVAVIAKPVPDSQIKKEIVNFSTRFRKPLEVKYLQVIAKRPVLKTENDAIKGRYLFSDEIYLY